MVLYIQVGTETSTGERTMSYFDTLYGALWNMSIQEIEDKALMNCLILLKDYLVMMLEPDEEREQ